MTQLVTPYDVIVEDDKPIDYNKLLTDWGTSLISQEMLNKIVQLTTIPLHPLLKRQTYFSHRSLDELLTNIENKKPFYVYTGRGPSADSMHIGHLLQFEFTKYLQDAFNVPVVIQLTDDEKFFWKDLSLVQTSNLAIENMKDIIACGFNPNNTFIFRDTDYVGCMYQNIVKIQKYLTANQVKHALGLTDTDNIGKYAYSAIQAAPSFASSFPTLFSNPNISCLIPCGIDQDGFFRMTRDVAPRLGYQKPAIIHSKFLPGLKGINSKMSSSNPETCILLTDTYSEIKKKINTKTFSGGKDTIEEHRQYGGNCNIDISYQYLTYFLEDDNTLNKIREQYSTGQLLSGELKKILIDVLYQKIQKHQENRSRITHELIKEFMNPNKKLIF